MVKKSNDETNRANREANLQLAGKIILVLAIIGIIVNVVLIFTPPLGGEDYATISIFTYNEGTDDYITTEFPTEILFNTTTGQSENITLYTVVSNHYSVAKYYEIQLKISLQTTLVNENIFGDNESTYFYQDVWKQKILSIDETWGPSAQTSFTFNFNTSIVNHLGALTDDFKIIFELWEWNSGLDAFSYTGNYVYLSSIELIQIT